MRADERDLGAHFQASPLWVVFAIWSKGGESGPGLSVG